MLQTGAETAANRRPCLPLAIVGDETVDLCRGVQFVHNIALLKPASCRAATYQPKKLVVLWENTCSDPGRLVRRRWRLQG